MRSQSKYVKGNPKFLDLVSTWQRKLGTVDSVLTLWRDVCRKWQALESIFVGSEDIREQLPEDSRRFDGVNVDFQDLQRLAPVRFARRGLLQPRATTACDAPHAHALMRAPTTSASAPNTCFCGG